MATPTPSEEAPLPSDDAPVEAEAEAPEAPARPAPRPAPGFKPSTMIILFLGALGFIMLIDTGTRNQIAQALGTYQNPAGPLYWLIGFGSAHLLVTMALAGALEMLITALAYNYTTDWVKAARVQKWNSAFRKAQMEAIRSGKKDRIAALKPYQERLTRLSSEVTIAQFKGMAITYFLLILIYTWVGLVIFQAPSFDKLVNLGGTQINLLTDLQYFGPIPPWFVIFSLYTIPTSMLFRRLLKTWWLRRYADRKQIVPAPLAPTEAGGPA